jgi:hypothetical protein
MTGPEEVFVKVGTVARHLAPGSVHQAVAGEWEVADE